MRNIITKLVLGVAITTIAMFGADNNSIGTWKRDIAKSVTVQVPGSILLDKPRRIVYCMVDECESGSPRKSARVSSE